MTTTIYAVQVKQAGRWVTTTRHTSKDEAHDTAVYYAKLNPPHSVRILIEKKGK